MQSHDYVPNVSGWKLNSLTGDFEINSAQISVGGLPEQPQMITVTAGEWTASELPTSAIEHYAFIGAEIFKIPAEYRESAHITTQDESFEPGFPDIRTSLTYQRPETAEEVAARVKASRCAGYSIKRDGDKFTFFHNGVPRIVLGDLDKATDKPETPFAVEGDQVFITPARVADGVITDKMAPRPGFSDSVVPSLSIKMSLTPEGRYFAAGIGIGITGSSPDEQNKASATELGKHLESVVALIKEETKARAEADLQFSLRVGTVETSLNALRARI
ncbi:hypothetical protein DNF23_10970 [Pseudomonas syringae pv. pisi]